MAHMLTINDLETRSEGTYYTGPLLDAQLFIRETANVSVVSRAKGKWTVLISQEGEEDTPTFQNCNEFGNGATEEIAWRYALGAAFGPADDDFVAFPLTHNEAEAVRILVNHHFDEEDRFDVFYSTTTAHAVVLSKDGDLWQVYPDGGIKVYRG